MQYKKINPETLKAMKELAAKAQTATHNLPWSHGGRYISRGGSAFAPAHTLAAEATVIAYVDDDRREANAVFEHLAQSSPANVYALITDHEQLQLGTEVALRNAQLLDRIRLCPSVLTAIRLTSISTTLL